MNREGQAYVERAKFGSWAPGEGRPSRPILVALREAGFLAQIGSRREPVGNFEAQYMSGDLERVESIIRDIDPDATRLTVGR